MIRSETQDGKTVFIDDSKNLPAPLMQAVQAALKAGFTDFTTPTPENDDKRIDWRVRRWVTTQNGEPAAFLIAYQDLATHFEILGPSIDLKPPKK